jgi:hypothetical protein
MRALHALRLLPDQLPAVTNDAVGAFSHTCVRALTGSDDVETALMGNLATIESSSSALTATQLLTFDEVANAVATLSGVIREAPSAH